MQQSLKLQEGFQTPGSQATSGPENLKHLAHTTVDVKNNTVINNLLTKQRKHNGT